MPYYGNYIDQNLLHFASLLCIRCSWARRRPDSCGKKNLRPINIQKYRTIILIILRNISTDQRGVFYDAADALATPAPVCMYQENT